MTADEVQVAADLAAARGYIGARVDPTDDRSYSVAGVTAGLTAPSAHDHAAISGRAVSTDAADDDGGAV